MCFPVNFPKFLRTPFLQNKVAASRITGSVISTKSWKNLLLLLKVHKITHSTKFNNVRKQNKIHHHFRLELSVNKRK